MMMPRMALVGAALAGFGMLGLSTPASALTMQECSAKYQAAQSAGTLNGMKWNDFRKAQCGADATPAAAAAPAPAPAATAAKPAPAPATAAPAKPAPAAAAAGAGKGAVFPTAIAPAYANESAGKARQKTCVDQYNANKATDANGGMKWIEKGGGYWSLCNKKLKGA